MINKLDGIILPFIHLINRPLVYITMTIEHIMQFILKDYVGPHAGKFEEKKSTS